MEYSVYWNAFRARWLGVVHKIWRPWIVALAISVGYLTWTAEIPDPNFTIDAPGYVLADWRMKAAINEQNIYDIDAVVANQKDQTVNGLRYRAAVIRGNTYAQSRCQGTVYPAGNQHADDGVMGVIPPTEFFDGNVNFVCLPTMGRLPAYVGVAINYVLKWILYTLLFIAVVEVLLWALRGINGKSSL